MQTLWCDIFMLLSYKSFAASDNLGFDSFEKHGQIERIDFDVCVTRGAFFDTTKCACLELFAIRHSPLRSQKRRRTCVARLFKNTNKSPLAADIPNWFSTWQEYRHLHHQAHEPGDRYPSLSRWPHLAEHS